jgi:hypothetical protein
VCSVRSTVTSAGSPEAAGAATPLITTSAPMPAISAGHSR